MRLFVAILLPEDVKNQLQQVQRLLARSGSGAFVSRENLHMTLAFVGPCPQVQSVAQALNRVKSDSFLLQGQLLGNFDSLQFVQMQAPTALLQLQKQICRVLEQAGLVLAQREFVPHITLCRRFQMSSPVQQEQALALLERISFCPHGFDLMSTQQTREGVFYRSFCHYPLAQNPKNRANPGAQKSSD